ncbi:MAG TPA: glycosyltransferase, partial [Solirubrobacteraceae bacterium]|nr:glycosyltransferase [Solirubrobacteraceae bacterium]
VDWFEMWSDSYWREYLGPVGGRVGMLVQRLCARVPQRAYCFSELHARRLREEGIHGTVTVLRGLYSGSAAPEAPRPADPMVLFAGRLIPEKRVTLAVEAIAIASTRIEGLRGVILGEGPEGPALRAAIAEHGLAETVSAPGFADGETLEAEMGRAMCMLLTSRREGYGMVVVEAAAHGTPSVVVAGEDNAAAELIVEGVNGTVAPRPDAEAVAEAIVRIHEAGQSLRRDTAAWFADNAEALSLESSLRTVLAGYSSARA